MFPSVNSLTKAASELDRPGRLLHHGLVLCRPGHCLRPASPETGVRSNQSTNSLWQNLTNDAIIE